MLCELFIQWLHGFTPRTQKNVAYFKHTIKAVEILTSQRHNFDWKKTSDKNRSDFFHELCRMTKQNRSTRCKNNGNSASNLLKASIAFRSSAEMRTIYEQICKSVRNHKPRFKHELKVLHSSPTLIGCGHMKDENVCLLSEFPLDFPMQWVFVCYNTANDVNVNLFES